MKDRTLIDAIKEFRKNINDNDYANLGAKGKYLTVPYRIKFVRDYFGERMSIQTTSSELSNGSHKFKAFIYLDDKLVSVGESKQMKNSDKEFEKQQTVSIGRGLSILGFFGDELATAEEMEQFLKPATTQKKPAVLESNKEQLSDGWISQLRNVAALSKSQNDFEKKLNPMRAEYKDDLISISLDPIQQLRVTTEYDKLKIQIQNNQTKRKNNNG
tara:strand:+ start:527 stop:1171 length:645 start_codon:yes stop_codon:yes gene_type:complete